MRKNMPLVVVVLVVLLGVTAFAVIPALRRSGPGHAIRWCLGEPMATQSVNDAAQTMLSAGWDKELMALSDQLMAEYASTASTLPEKLVAGKRLVPLARLPQKFHALSEGHGNLELILRSDQGTVPTAVALSWDNGRHEIIVYAQPPTTPPEGFFVRRINDRLYIVASES